MTRKFFGTDKCRMKHQTPRKNVRQRRGDVLVGKCSAQFRHQVKSIEYSLEKAGKITFQWVRRDACGAVAGLAKKGSLVSSVTSQTGIRKTVDSQFMTTDYAFASLGNTKSSRYFQSTFVRESFFSYLRQILLYYLKICNNKFSWHLKKPQSSHCNISHNRIIFANVSVVQIDIMQLRY